MICCTVTSVNEREGSIYDNVRIPRKGEQGGRRDNGHRGRRNRNRNRQGNPNWYAPNERYTSRNPNVNRNNDRNWNEFRRYQNNNYDDRDHYNMNTNRSIFMDMVIGPIIMVLISLISREWKIQVILISIKILLM